MTKSKKNKSVDDTDLILNGSGTLFVFIQILVFIISIFVINQTTDNLKIFAANYFVLTTSSIMDCYSIKLGYKVNNNMVKCFFCSMILVILIITLVAHLSILIGLIKLYNINELIFGNHVIIPGKVDLNLSFIIPAKFYFYSIFTPLSYHIIQLFNLIDPRHKIIRYSI